MPSKQPKPTPGDQHARFLTGVARAAGADLNSWLTIVLSALAQARSDCHGIADHGRWAAVDRNLDAATLAAHRCADVAAVLLNPPDPPAGAPAAGGGL